MRYFIYSIQVFQGPVNYSLNGSMISETFPNLVSMQRMAAEAKSDTAKVDIQKPFTFCLNLLQEVSYKDIIDFYQGD